MPNNTLIGATLEHYRIDRMVGQGGMAAVYEATDLRLQRQVAIKVMHDHLAAHKSFRDRFAQEAYTVANLDHPNIVRVFSFSAAADTLYLVMELISGGNLRKHVKRLAENGIIIDHPEAIEIVRQLANALHYAHQREMVHCDVKPDNVLLKPLSTSSNNLNYRPILTDFGLAQLNEAADEEAITGQQPVGTYPYMSPEQCNADPVDARTDIYALGIMLYELSVGRLPFNPKSIAEAARVHNQEPVPAPSSLRQGFPPNLEAVILRCLAKQADQRYQSAAELAQELGALLRPATSTTQAPKRGLPLAPADAPPPTSSTRPAPLIPAPMVLPAASLPDDIKTDLDTATLPAQQPKPSPVQPPEKHSGDEDKDVLVFIKQNQASYFILERDLLIVGRGDDCDIPLEWDYLSRQHLRLERKPNGLFTMADMGSVNGTFADGKRLTPNEPIILRTRMEIRLADGYAYFLPAEVLQQVLAEPMPEVLSLDAVPQVEAVTTGEATQLIGIIPPSARPTLTPPPLEAEQMQYDRLVLYVPGEAPRLVLLDDVRYTIGRDPSNTIVLDRPGISRRHAIVHVRSDGEFVISDLGSTNGTWLENERIPAQAPTRLNASKVMRLGDVWMTFEARRELGAVFVGNKVTDSLTGFRVNRVDLIRAQAGTQRDEDDGQQNTVVLIKPLDEEMPTYSEPPISFELRAKDRLVFYSEEHPIRIIPIDKETMTIGRAPNIDIRLAGRRVSRSHAQIDCRPDGNIYVTDLNSKNGVWVGDTLLVPKTQVLWSKSEILRLGNYWVKYEPGTGLMDVIGGGMDERGLVGRTLGQYRIDRYVGESPLSAVYKATDTQLDRVIALRIMNPNWATEPALRQRFLEEARIISRLDHPNIIKVLSYNIIDNELFMVMEYVVGGSIRSIINRQQNEGRQVDLAEILDMMIQLANGLHYAHQQGLLHRSIRPENIVVRETSVVGPIVRYQPVLTDFSLARYAQSEEVFETERPEVVYPYLSPEQASGQRTDIRSDIYELGVLLFEILAGRPPFQPRSMADAVRMHTREAIPHIYDYRAEVPLELDAILTRALQKNPNERYQTGIEFARALQKVLLMTSKDAESIGYMSSVVDQYATQTLDDSLPRAMPLMTVPPLAGDEDRIVFFSETNPTKVISLSQPIYTIGRANDQDIVLESDKVSRRHLRLERSGDGTYRIRDVGSSNGSFLGAYRLIENVMEIWDTDETLRVGDYWVRLDTIKQRLELQPATIIKQTTAPAEAPKPRVQLPKPEHDKIGLTISNPVAQVAAGSTATLSIEIVNLQEVVDHFKVDVTGLPNGWVTQANEGIELLPNNRQTVSFTFHPPRQSASTSGSHAFEVRVTGRSKKLEAVRVQGTLVIEPFHSYSVELYPPRLTGRGQAEITVRNTGNAYATYGIQLRDREQKLRFGAVGKLYQLPPGQTEAIPIEVRPQRRPLLGRQQTLAFEAIITAEPGGPAPTQTLTGDLVVNPRFRLWMLLLLFFILLLLAIVAALIGVSTAQQVIGYVTQTAAASATNYVATQTAIVFADDDGDGLSNLREAELLTDPKKADTDEDGLSDGQEVQVWSTNPTNRDSDGDTVPDGEEAENGTNPLKEDTDGDELKDNEDPFPLQQSTPTITPFPTVPGTEGDVCPGSPIPSRLANGMQAEVEPGGVENRIRAEPNKEAEIIGLMPPGSVFIITGGPECDTTDQVRWWKVQYEGLEGWTAEGEKEEYYLRPPMTATPAPTAAPEAPAAPQ